MDIFKLIHLLLAQVLFAITNWCTWDANMYDIELILDCFPGY